MKKTICNLGSENQPHMPKLLKHKISYKVKNFITTIMLNSRTLRSKGFLLAIALSNPVRWCVSKCTSFASQKSPKSKSDFSVFLSGFSMKSPPYLRQFVWGLALSGFALLFSIVLFSIVLYNNLK